MNVTRSALKLHLQNSPIRYHQFFFFSRFNNALIRNPTFSSSSSSLFNFNATRFFSVTLPRQTHQTQPFVGSAVSSEDFNGRDTFFAEDNVSWSSIGLSHTLSRALSNIALNTPSLVQASSIPSVLSGKDVVIAAETGSGKTYSYLLPLIDKLRGTEEYSLDVVSDKEISPPARKVLLVLCPNVQLCEQVVRMANSLCGDNDETIVSAAAICGKQGWPIREPDIIVTTPAALLNHVDVDRRRRMEFMHGVKYVVFDEADMLLCGSFQNKVIRLINLLRYDEKLLSRSKTSVSELPVTLESSLSSHDASEGEEEFPTEAMSDEEDDDNEDIANINNEAESVKKTRRDWRRVRKHFERSKQYVFVAATLPVNGKKTAGALLKHMFPDAEWVSGNYLHCHNPRLKQRWIEVTVDTQVKELIRAVNHSLKLEDLDIGSGIHRTMVFANTVEAVEAVVKILGYAGLECLRYHKNCTLDERAQTLVDFYDKGGVLVCTDAAARGVDIPNVSHVIQADFATSAVDFLHRIGRTARAGQIGLVTSMYTESNRELVDAVRRAGELGLPVETAFSRKRSFRNKIKKKASANKVRDSATIEESLTA
ncbi:putative RNA helicase [Medicago truncatula]|uniref:DEAD-box ATP-dependent RNA helicase n=1 Tax=Medicago truncatula TaxID=3880 RepID=G7LEQ4_MEDTR|nr:DEAD-box ATP-dependent RNA helicase 22 [Medicago truncatula]AET03099.1 DEAD-box ATP-dependent RNA helicase [Medicago truncatula]RHN41265.1 putative RNA helicase [Medicago truncatula]